VTFVRARLDPVGLTAVERTDESYLSHQNSVVLNLVSLSSPFVSPDPIAVD
jgi:hypothetical protein